MKTLVLENKNIREVLEWFEKNNYNIDEIKIGRNAYYSEGIQNADFYEIEISEEDEYRYNVYSC